MPSYHLPVQPRPHRPSSLHPGAATPRKPSLISPGYGHLPSARHTLFSPTWARALDQASHSLSLSILVSKSGKACRELVLTRRSSLMQPAARTPLPPHAAALPLQLTDGDSNAQKAKHLPEATQPIGAPHSSLPHPTAPVQFPAVTSRTVRRAGG